MVVGGAYSFLFLFSLFFLSSFSLFLYLFIPVVCASACTCEWSVYICNRGYWFLFCTWIFIGGNEYIYVLNEGQNALQTKNTFITSVYCRLCRKLFSRLCEAISNPFRTLLHVCILPMYQKSNNNKFNKNPAMQIVNLYFVRCIIYLLVQWSSSKFHIYV